jgi:hypothetical protein
MPGKKMGDDLLLTRPKTIKAKTSIQYLESSLHNTSFPCPILQDIQPLKPVTIETAFSRHVRLFLMLYMGADKEVRDNAGSGILRVL